MPGKIRFLRVFEHLTIGCSDFSGGAPLNPESVAGIRGVSQLLGSLHGSPFCLKIRKIVFMPQGVAQAGGQSHLFTLQKRGNGGHFRFASTICSRHEHARHHRRQRIDQHATTDIRKPGRIDSFQIIQQLPGALSLRF